jgi:hypothetical protein
MKLEKLQSIRPILLVLAIFGMLGVNGTFLYYSIMDKATYDAAMSNGLALVFIAEAFLLMFFFAFIIAKMGWKKPGWVFFIAMSIIGSMAFSIPLQLYLWSKPEKQ